MSRSSSSLQLYKEPFVPSATDVIVDMFVSSASLTVMLVYGLSDDSLAIYVGASCVSSSKDNQHNTLRHVFHRMKVKATGESEI